MKTKEISASYVKSIQGTDKILFDGKPQVTFLGRSNVGKSSLINALVGKELARSSSRPGKTVNIDFFLINGSSYFVDLPGYGYAKISKDEHLHFRKMIAWYLFSSGVKHKLAVLIVDSVVGLTDFDRESVALLTSNNVPFVIAANKIDKLKMGERAKKLAAIQEESRGVTVIPFSSVTSEGRQKLLKIIFSSR